MEYLTVDLSMVKRVYMLLNVHTSLVLKIVSYKIPYIFSRTWLPKLRNMTSECTEENYANLLESLCKNGRGPEVIELIVEWLAPELGNVKKQDTVILKLAAMKFIYL